MSNQYKIVLTGGHLTPAIAMMQELTNHQHQVMLIGRRYSSKQNQVISREAEETIKLGQSFSPILEVKFDRYRRLQSLLSLPLLTIAIGQAWILLNKFRPDIILSFGGYLAIPVCIAAKMLRIPVILHDETSAPGLANRVIAPLARRIAVGFEIATSNFPPAKVVVTGNPLRPEILQPVSQVPKWLPKIDKPIIYITGGNQGSHIINQTIAQIAPNLLNDFILVHQTGDAQKFNDYENLIQLRNSLPTKLQHAYQLSKWFNASEVGWLMSQAHMVISRGGANTITEILFHGLPAVILPLPLTSGNEQVKNAQQITISKAGILLEHQLISPTSLTNAINQIHQNYQQFRHHAQQLKEQHLYHQHATTSLYQLIIETINHGVK